MKYALKPLKCSIEIIAVVGLPVEGICLVSCIRDVIEFTGLKLRNQ